MKYMYARIVTGRFINLTKERQESRAKNQEPGAKNKDQRLRRIEPRTKTKERYGVD
jgi:hypothetical protein